jgi:hypothetical protein
VGFAALKNVFALAAFYVAAAHKENAPLRTHKQQHNKGAYFIFRSPLFRSSARRKGVQLNLALTSCMGAAGEKGTHARDLRNMLIKNSEPIIFNDCKLKNIISLHWSQNLPTIMAIKVLSIYRWA